MKSCTIHELAKEFCKSTTAVQQLIRKAGISSCGKRGLHKLYSLGAVRTAIENNKILSEQIRLYKKLNECELRGTMTAATIAASLGLTAKAMNGVIERIGIQPKSVLTGYRGRPAYLYDVEELTSIMWSRLYDRRYLV